MHGNEVADRLRWAEYLHMRCDGFGCRTAQWGRTMLGWSHPRCHGTHGVRGYDDDRLRRTRMRPVRLRKVEGTVQDHGNRLDVVELRLEESQQYRFLRVEHSAALDELSQRARTQSGLLRQGSWLMRFGLLFGAWRRLERKHCKRGIISSHRNR